jgi:hypothetical protein
VLQSEYQSAHDGGESPRKPRGKIARSASLCPLKEHISFVEYVGDAKVAQNDALSAVAQTKRNEPVVGLDVALMNMRFIRLQAGESSAHHGFEWEERFFDQSRKDRARKNERRKEMENREWRKEKGNNKQAKQLPLFHIERIHSRGDTLSQITFCFNAGSRCST